MAGGEDRRNPLRRRAWARFALLLAALLLLFSAARLAHLQWDLTEDRRFTLSDSTRGVLAALEEPILIRAYVTEGLPQPYGRMRRFLEDMLRAYRDAGGENVAFDIVDPAGDPNAAAALRALDVPKVQVQVVEDDRAQVRRGYLAVVVEYLDRRETIPVVRDEAGFEYRLTRKIKKISGKGRAKVGVAANFGAAGARALTSLRRVVEDDYELQPVRPGEEPLPADLAALVIPGFERPPSPAARYAIDQFRLSGGGLLVLAGNVKPELRQGFAVRPVEEGANDWLTGLGVAVEPGLVVDARASRVVVNQREGQFVFRNVVDYPFLPSVRELDPDHPVTAGLESVRVPFASPLEFAGGAEGTVLLASSPRSAVQTGPPYDVDPLTPAGERLGGLDLRPLKLALLLSGAAESAFEAPPEGSVTSGDHIARGEATRAIVVGAPALLTDDFFEGGAALFTLNALDWMAGDEGLIALRSRGATDRPLVELGGTARAAWKGMWMFGLPLVVVLLGAWRWLSRRRAARER